MSFHREPLGQKVVPCVSRAIRDSARGQSCTLRSPGCDGGGETTVLAHVRAFGNAGVAQKPHDFHSCYACGPCHELMDSRDWLTDGMLGWEDVLRAMMETQRRLYAAGLIGIPASWKYDNIDGMI